MECEICRYKFNYNKKKPIVLYPCSHTFCHRCIESWQDKYCPTCQVEIKDSNINWTVLKLTLEKDSAAIIRTEMPKDMQQFAIDCAQLAIINYGKLEYSKMATFVKEEFDKKYGKHWCCFVGEKIGCAFCYEDDQYVCFDFGSVRFLVFKYPDSNKEINLN